MSTGDVSPEDVSDAGVAARRGSMVTVGFLRLSADSPTRRPLLTALCLDDGTLKEGVVRPLAFNCS